MAASCGCVTLQLGDSSSPTLALDGKMKPFVVAGSAPAVDLFSDHVHAASWVWAAHEVSSTHGRGIDKLMIPCNRGGAKVGHVHQCRMPSFSEVPHGGVQSNVGNK